MIRSFRNTNCHVSISYLKNLLSLLRLLFTFIVMKQKSLSSYQIGIVDKKLPIESIGSILFLRSHVSIIHVSLSWG